MSHSPGKVLDVSGTVIGHFEYNGTVGSVLPQVFATAEELSAAWRKEQPRSCGCLGVPVTLRAENQDWGGRYCPEHRFIRAGFAPWDRDEEGW